MFLYLNVNLKFLLKIRETQSNGLCIETIIMIIKIPIKYQEFFVNKIYRTIQKMMALYFFI